MRYFSTKVLPLLLSFVPFGAYASLNLPALPVAISLEAPQELTSNSPRPATLVIRALPGKNLQNIRALVIDPIDADLQISRTYSPLVMDPSDSRFRVPQAIAISLRQTELRIPLTLKPKGREASALELSFLTETTGPYPEIAFHTLLVLEKSPESEGAQKYRVVSEPKFLHNRRNANSPQDLSRQRVLRTTTQKRADRTLEARALGPQILTPRAELPPGQPTSSAAIDNNVRQE